MRISDWSSDVCSSDLHREVVAKTICKGNAARREGAGAILQAGEVLRFLCPGVDRSKRRRQQHRGGRGCQAISLEHHPRYLPFMRPAVAGPWLFPVRLAPSPFGDQRALPSVGERPKPELLLGDLPEPRQAGRLDGKEEDDQGAEQDRKSTRLNSSH